MNLEMSIMEQFLTERGFASATNNAVAALAELKKRDMGQETIDSRTLQKPEVWRPKDAEEEMSGGQSGHSCSKLSWPF